MSMQLIEHMEKVWQSSSANVRRAQGIFICLRTTQRDGRCVCRCASTLRKGVLPALQSKVYIELPPASYLILMTA